MEKNRYLFAMHLNKWAGINLWMDHKIKQQQQIRKDWKGKKKVSGEVEEKEREGGGQKTNSESEMWTNYERSRYQHMRHSIKLIGTKSQL